MRYGSYGTTTAHRWGYARLVGPVEPGQLVCHTCDNGLCCNPAHWFLGTHRDNNEDMAAKGRSPSGAAHHASKLTQAQADTIRADFASGEIGVVALARLHLVSHQVISRIVRGESYLAKQC